MKIIAEFGSNLANHDWNFRDFCIAAQLAGADACKIQLFKAEHFPAGEQASKKPLEFPRERVFEFVQACHEYGMEAGASVFDFDAVDIAAKHCDFVKLAGREVENTELIMRVFNSAKMVYRSVPDVFWSSVGVSSDIVSLYVIPEYPTSLLKALVTIVRHYRYFASGWGWSSHSRSIWDCVLAAKLGASVIEKHLALAPTDIEAGHSLLPGDFGKMVRMCK